MKKNNFCANLHAVGDLRYEPCDFPTPKDDEVIVALRACGVCGSDLGRVYKSGTYHFPTVIGHEFSGVVVEDTTGDFLHKRVAVFPLLPCFACESCHDGNYATCKSYDYYGSRRDGGMSLYLAVRRFNLIPMPDGITYEEGAMCEPASVAHHAVCKLSITKGETLLISGAGPIGIIAGQWARAMGAKQIFYLDIDARKLDIAKKMGFAVYKGGEHIDCAIEGTGVSSALENALAAVEPFGRAVLMGNPAGEMTLSQKGYWHILRKELTLLGTWNSSFSEKQNDWQASLDAMANGVIDVSPLISHKYPLSRVNEAFEMMKNKSELYQKVMLTMNEEAENE